MQNAISKLLMPLAFFCFCATGAQSEDDASEVADICNSAAAVAARESGVPVDVLRAISLTETGRRTDFGFAPWPWAVNMAGQGRWFDSFDAARSYVFRHQERGARNFDVGCFQINYRWHGQAFSSVDEMFDPLANARYAAQFLAQLHKEFGNWSSAAGAYHSRTKKHAKKYTARFDRIRASLPNRSGKDAIDQTLMATRQEEPSQNRYPLLIATNRASGASLVPQTQGRVVFLEATGRRPLVELN